MQRWYSHLLQGVSGQPRSRRLQHRENGNYNKHAQIIKEIFQGSPKAWEY